VKDYPIVLNVFQPYYYAIKGKRKDGFTYVLYINGGHPPWSLLVRKIITILNCTKSINEPLPFQRIPLRYSLVIVQ
jgi:hypothetical protein